MDTKLIKFELHGVTYRVSCDISAYGDVVDGNSHYGSSEFGGRTFEADGQSESNVMLKIKRKLLEEIECQHQRELAKLSEWNTGKAIAGER